jgi:hypothetical protein
LRVEIAVMAAAIIRSIARATPPITSLDGDFDVGPAFRIGDDKLPVVGADGAGGFGGIKAGVRAVGCPAGRTGLAGGGIGGGTGIAGR